MRHETVIPPEVLAIPLPEGYKWGMLDGDPIAICTTSTTTYSNGWVNYVNTKPGHRSIRLPDKGYIPYPDPEVTRLQLCKALATHLWFNHD